MDELRGPAPVAGSAVDRSPTRPHHLQDGPLTSAVLVTEPGAYELVHRPLPSLLPGEALIRIHAAGVCRDDAEVLRGGRPHSYVRYPVVPGHEWSGTVEDIGPGVQPALLGRKVVGESMSNCQTCQRCRLGENTLCESGYEEAGFTRPGGMATTMTLPARSLHLLPEDADLTAAALLEPAARAAAAVLASAPDSQDRVAIVGDGTPGLLAAQVLAASGERRNVTVIGSHPAREDAALACGASAYLAPQDPHAADFDIVIDTAGSSTAMQASLQALRNGGRLICTSAATGQGQLDPRYLTRRQLHVQSAHGAPTAAWVHVLGLYAQGLLSLLPLITHDLPLEQFQKAVDLTVSDDPAVGKVLLRPGS